MGDQNKVPVIIQATMGDQNKVPVIVQATMGDHNQIPVIVQLFKCPLCAFKSHKQSTMQHLDIAHSKKDSSTIDENLPDTVDQYIHSEINEVEKDSSSTDESSSVCPFKCSSQFDSIDQLQKHIDTEHPEPELQKSSFQCTNKTAKNTQNIKNTRYVKKLEIKSSSIQDEARISDESSEFLLIPMPNESVNTVPTLDTMVQFNGSIVPFSFLLLHAEFVMAKKHLEKLHYEKTTCKFGRPMAIEWLEKRIPKAVHWSHSTLNDRFIKAERQAINFVKNKAMGQGPSDEIKDQMGHIVKELEQMRNTIKEYDTRVRSKKNKRTNIEENDGQTTKHLKANAFMKSLETKKSMTFSNPNFEAEEEVIRDQSGDYIERTSAEEPALVGNLENLLDQKDRGNRDYSRFKKTESKIKEITATSRQEADVLRRSSVMDAYDKRFQTVVDDDVALRNMSSGWDNLANLATKVLEQELNGGPNNQQMQLVECKLKTIEKTQEKVELQAKNSSERLNVIEQNQEGQSKRLDTIEKNQDSQTKTLNEILSYLKKEDEKKDTNPNLAQT